MVLAHFALFINISISKNRRMRVAKHQRNLAEISVGLGRFRSDEVRECYYKVEFGRLSTEIAKGEIHLEVAPTLRISSPTFLPISLSSIVPNQCLIQARCSNIFPTI